MVPISSWLEATVETSTGVNLELLATFDYAAISIESAAAHSIVYQTHGYWAVRLHIHCALLRCHKAVGPTSSNGKGFPKRDLTRCSGPYGECSELCFTRQGLLWSFLSKAFKVILLRQENASVCSSVPSSAWSSPEIPSIHTSPLWLWEWWGVGWGLCVVLTICNIVYKCETGTISNIVGAAQKQHVQGIRAVDSISAAYSI